MRLLFLCHRLPWPPHKGEKIRSFNILKYLASRHEIYLAGLVDEVGDVSQLSALRPLVRELLFERLHPKARRLLAMGSLLAARPVTSTYFHSLNLQRRVDALIEQKQIQAVFCSSSPMAEYIFRSRHVGALEELPRVMDLIDVDSAKWTQYAAESGPWSAWLYRREARCLAALEERIARSFDRVLVVSEQEKRYFPMAGGSERLLAVGNGVDLDYFKPRARLQSAAPTLVFTGVMDYRPNVQGILWFAERILPQVRAAVPDVRLVIVGNRPARSVALLGRRAGIEVTGFVPDVREHLAQASLCIAPLRIARGVQNKVLEAMAMGRPVVATPQAFEGIEATPGQDLLVADSEEEFAGQTIELLRHSSLAEQIGDRARACVERRYAWQRQLQVLDQLFPVQAVAVRNRLPQAV
jgi:sugar transferase (PEP-CTERM/EpsH1 system associated)